MNNPRRPVQSWKHKGINVALWENDKGWLSVQIRRTYMDEKTQQWKDTNSFSLRDIPFLISILNEVLATASPDQQVANPMQQSEWTKKATVDTEIDDIPF